MSLFPGLALHRLRLMESFIPQMNVCAATLLKGVQMLAQRPKHMYAAILTHGWLGVGGSSRIAPVPPCAHPLWCTRRRCCGNAAPR